MLPNGHFAVGASSAFVVNFAIYAVRRFRTIFRHLILMAVTTIFCGFWAFGPDWGRFFFNFFHLPYTYSPEAHKPGWPDIFFFHGYLDTNFPKRGTIVGLAVIIFIFSALIVIYLIEIRRLLNILRRLRKPRSHSYRDKVD